MRPTDYRYMARDTSSGVAIYLKPPACVCEPFVLWVYVDDLELRKEEFYCVDTDDATDRFLGTVSEFKQAGLMGGLTTNAVKGIV